MLLVIYDNLGCTCYNELLMLLLNDDDVQYIFIYLKEK